MFTPGERICVGVDVGGERSASAVVYVNEHLDVGVETARSPPTSPSSPRSTRSSRPCMTRAGRTDGAGVLIAAQPWCSICGATKDLTADHVTPSRSEAIRLAHFGCSAEAAIRREEPPLERLTLLGRGA